MPIEFPLVAVAQKHKFWVAAGLGIAVIEYTQISIGFEAPDPVTGEGGLREDYVPGDLGFDPLGLKPEDEAGRNLMETKELNHGRLAVSEVVRATNCEINIETGHRQTSNCIPSSIGSSNPGGCSFPSEDLRLVAFSSHYKTII